MRHAAPQPLPARRSPVAAGHLGRGSRLIDEDEPLGIEVELAVEPCLTPAPDVGAALFVRVCDFF